MSLAELEAALRGARERVLRMMERDPQPQRQLRPSTIDELKAANTAVLRAERSLAEANGEPYAVPIESFFRGRLAGSPHLLKNDYRTFLIYYVKDIHQNRNDLHGSTSRSDNNAGERYVVVEFERCICTKMGTPNDEVLHGHPLNGKGLDMYEGMSVKNSAWLKELQAINSVHGSYREKTWLDLNHYILTFQDSTFECVARGFKVEEFQMSLLELLAEICKRLA